MTPRGPYKSAVAGMSPAQAAAWFKANQCRDHRSTAESAYVNAKFRCSHYAKQVGQNEAKSGEREYYHQGHDARAGA
jgi:hypothetical protein